MAKTWDRRELLAGSAGLVSWGGVASAVPAPDLSDWNVVRNQFAIDRQWIHLASFFLTSHPAPVRAAIEQHRRGLDEAPLIYTFNNKGRCEREAREAAAEYLGKEREEVALTDSTTMGLGLVYGGLRLKAGQEILTTEHDHWVTESAIAVLAARSGAPVRRIALYQRSATASADEMAAAVEKAMRPATRLVAVTWVHSGTGVKVPLRAIADVIARANRGRAEEDRALLAVDGVHGFGVENVTASDLGCDIFIAGCHKWLFGPRGTGIVWATPAAWQATTAIIPSFDGAAPQSHAMSPGGFHSFEHRWALPAAFRFHRDIGKARVAARVHELNRQCKEGLAAMKHVRLMTPRSDAVSAGLVCFEVEGLTPQEVIEKIGRKKIIASVSPYRVPYARFAPSLLTMPEDIEKALAEIRALA
jgi:isopenicillin-N epimerase